MRLLRWWPKSAAGRTVVSLFIFCVSAYTGIIVHSFATAKEYVPSYQQIVPEDDMIRAVNEHAQQVASLVGKELKTIDMVSDTCLDDNEKYYDYVYRTTGNYQVILPVEQYQTILDQFRAYWEGRSYSVSRRSIYSVHNSGLVTVAMPDGFRMSLRAAESDKSGPQSKQLLLEVDSHCRRSPTRLF